MGKYKYTVMLDNEITRITHKGTIYKIIAPKKDYERVINRSFETKYDYKSKPWLDALSNDLLDDLEGTVWAHITKVIY
jgi:hypothetical protein